MKPKKTIKHILYETIQIIATAALIAFILNTFLIANCRVPSGSMEPTIMTGDRIIGSRLAYGFSTRSGERSLSSIIRMMKVCSM